MESLIKIAELREQDGSAALGLALGTAQWGMKYGVANRTGQPKLAELASMLDLAKDVGVRIIDTARAYGASEEIIGQLVGNDSNWLICTKLDPFAMTKSAAVESLRISRNALRRSLLDCVLTHRSAQRTTDSDSPWHVLCDERAAGRVISIGCSATTFEDAWSLLDNSDIDCIQVAAGLLDQRLQRSGFFEQARIAGKSVMVRSVFLQGVAHLRSEEVPIHLKQLQPSLLSIHQWCKKQQTTPITVFLAYAAKLPNAWILCGCETLQQLQENFDCWKEARRMSAVVDDIANQIPEFPIDVLSPALWPQ